MLKNFKRKLRDTYLFNIYSKIRSVKHYWDWIESGKPVPPPHIVKKMTVLEYANRFNAEIFVETGTHLGSMVYAVRNSFKEIHSIELSPYFYKLANKRFSTYGHINLINGDSSEELKNVINRINGVCLFWLDGHYSGGITVKGKKETPIMEELEAIFDSGLKNNIILIDDARNFNGEGDFPTIEHLQEFVHDKNDECVISIKHDIIRIHKKNRHFSTLFCESTSELHSRF